MRRVGLALLMLVACTDDEGPRGEPPGRPGMDGGRDAGRDARVPFDAARPTQRDGSWPWERSYRQCNPPSCSLPAGRCASNSDCCQPFLEGYEVTCQGGYCDSDLIDSDELWRQPLGFCGPDGGRLPENERASSLERCNDAACADEGAGCARDEDCCQPSNVLKSRAVCTPGGVCGYLLQAPKWEPPLLSCLPDGGFPRSCLPRASRCVDDADCCKQPGPPFDPSPITRCLGGYCDVLAF